MTILDTNVISELMRPTPEPLVLQWFNRLSADDAHLTSITVAEILDVRRVDEVCDGFGCLDSFRGGISLRLEAG